jgi:hypothetical protein
VDVPRVVVLCRSHGGKGRKRRREGTASASLSVFRRGLEHFMLRVFAYV